MKSRLFAVTALSALLSSMPVALSAESSASSGVTMIAPLSVSVTRNLSFGTIAPSAEAGTVTTEGVCSASVTCLGGHHHGKFQITGEPNRAVIVPQPADILLTHTDGQTTMSVTNFTGSGGSTNNWGSSRTITSDGNLGTRSIGIRATLNVGANQLAGAYTGTFTLTAEYQ